VLLLETRSQPIVYWFGDWGPRNGIAVGISFVIDPMAAGMAALASFLFAAALIFRGTTSILLGLYITFSCSFSSAQCAAFA
jgi:hypothetical protein